MYKSTLAILAAVLLTFGPLAHADSIGFRLSPNLDFYALQSFAHLDLLTDASSASVRLYDARISAKFETNPEAFVSLSLEGIANTSRHVEKLFLGSLTQVEPRLELAFRFKPKSFPVTIRAQAQVNKELYFDIDQEASAKYLGEPSELSNEAYYAVGKMGWNMSEDTELFVQGKYGIWIGTSSDFATSQPLALNVGLETKITNGMHASLSAGYANSFLKITSNDTSLDGVSMPFSAQARFNWDIVASARLSLSVARELINLPLFLEAYANSVELSFRQHFAQHWRLVLAPYLRFYEYGKPLAPDHSGRLAGTPRNDILFGLREELAYAFNNWISLGISHEGTFRWTNASDMQISPAGGKLAHNSDSYGTMMNKHEIFLFARLSY